ncbi:MAG TPA: methylated-DNA--[protein]-cysteine S-methyltransferase [Thermoanaerobaculia bacterium]|nr:methylated-DNA--[protein]-cysteine S-methyltransferase [Thermoanaerobaculia bacterium]
MDTPVGPLLLVAGGDGLQEIRFGAGGATGPLAEDRQADGTDILREAQAQLAAYFAGRLREFDLPLAPRGGAFELRVWQALREIPYGATCSYFDIARRLGSPGASRAVGAANGRNPMPIVVPCHRVIGADGSLTGYGGGLETKRYLLRLEGALQADLFDPALPHRRAEPAP